MHNIIIGACINPMLSTNELIVSVCMIIVW